jgi:hypothetical protein
MKPRCRKTGSKMTFATCWQLWGSLPPTPRHQTGICMSNLSSRTRQCPWSDTVVVWRSITVSVEHLSELAWADHWHVPETCSKSCVITCLCVRALGDDVPDNQMHAEHALDSQRACTCDSV